MEVGITLKTIVLYWNYTKEVYCCFQISLINRTVLPQLAWRPNSRFNHELPVVCCRLCPWKVHINYRVCSYMYRAFIFGTDMHLCWAELVTYILNFSILFQCSWVALLSFSIVFMCPVHSKMSVTIDFSYFISSCQSSWRIHCKCGLRTTTISNG